MKSPFVSKSPLFASILIGLTTCLGVITTEAESTGNDAGPPNIVLILVDDLGWSDISTHGGRIPTPDIDRLFEQGVEFPNFMGWSVCSPSRSMLLTGRHPFRLGLGPKVGGVLDTKETTIAEVFRAQGYRTGVFGKWDISKGPDIPEYREASSRAINQKPGRKPETGPGANAYGFDEAWVYYSGGGDHFTRASPRNPEAVSWWHNRDYRPQDKGYTDDLITQHAREFIRENRARPFFCYVSYHIIHAPLQAKPADLERVPAAITGEKQRLYGAMLLALNDNTRQLIAELERLNLHDNTIVFFTSDNGATLTGSNKPFRGVKHQFYEGGIRLPTAIRWPRAGLVGGEVWDGLWGLLDLYRTLVDMAGLTMPQTQPMDGKNVWPAIRESEISPVESYYWASRRKDVIRTSEWKLHRYFNRYELYDIRNDDGERNNLADEKPEVVDGLEARMNEWALSLGAGLAHQPPPIRLDSNPAPDGEVLEVSVTVTEQGQQNGNLIVPIAEYAGRRIATDFIEFDLCTAPSSMTKGFFVSSHRRNDNPPKLDFLRGVGIDQFGREQALGPATRGGERLWEHRIVGLLGVDPVRRARHVVVFKGNRQGTYRIFIDNLRIRHVDGSTTAIWQDESDTRHSEPLDLPPGFSDLRVRAVQLADLNTTIEDRPTESLHLSSGNHERRLIFTLLVVSLGALAVGFAVRAFK